MSDLIGTLSLIGWIMGAIATVALWMDHRMRKEREREQARQREARKSGSDNDVA
jgi:uncharacterized membrane protein YciS (DUF1049 family)